VLSRFSREQRSELDAMLDVMVDAMECWLVEGIERAMSGFNR
jgi:hypothetical protein